MAEKPNQFGHPVNIGAAKPTKIKSDPAASAGKHGGMNQGGGHHR
jgi:hypothetical protein